MKARKTKEWADVLRAVCKVDDAIDNASYAVKKLRDALEAFEKSNLVQGQVADELQRRLIELQKETQKLRTEKQYLQQKN